MTNQEISVIYGKIKLVENFPDYKVKIVDGNADLNVVVVNDFPNSLGKWKIVSNFPDFKIKIVENFADFTIKFVDHFPGFK